MIELTDGLTESQKRAVLHKDGPLLVLAGPGSGKTRVITHRIAALVQAGVRPWNICAITFTNKAAEEMRNRVQKMGIASGAHLSTFHSLCVRLLRTYNEKAGIGRDFSIYDTDDQIKCIKEVLKTSNISGANFTPSNVANSISRLKNELQSPEEFSEIADDFASKNIAKIYTAYQKILNKNNALDFDDLLLKTAKLINNNPDVRQELNNRFQYLLVDEYQDTNHAQYQIARGLSIEHKNLCVTGDPDQSIYKWRGANIKNILSFEKDYPDAAVVRLEENFRSTASILKKADMLIKNNRNRKAKTLVPTVQGGDEISIDTYDDQTEEAYSVAQKINELTKKGHYPNEVAVFYRTNSMSRQIEEALVQNKVPYQIVRGVEFYGRREIRDILAYLKVLVNPADDAALERIINTPARGIGKTTVERIKAYASSKFIPMYSVLKDAAAVKTIASSAAGKLSHFAAMMESFKPFLAGAVKPLMEKVFKETGLSQHLKSDKSHSESAFDNVMELINSAGLYDQQTENPQAVDYLQSIALYSDTDAYDSNVKKVSLMTLHAAKGLEFDNVFIVGLEEGILPHERSIISNEDLEEERRLFFVGMTRARKNLFISHAKHRTVFGQFMRNTPSQFLDEIGYTGDYRKRVYDNNFDIEDKDDNADSVNYDYQDSQIEPAVRTVAKKPLIKTADKKQEPQFKTGQLVKHSKFGLGRVSQFMDMGENSIVVVKFNSGQTRSLMLKYANLEKM